MLARTVAAVLALSALSPAIAAAAPTLSKIKSCYVSVRIDRATGQAITESVALRGSGFTANSRVDVSIDGVDAVTGVQIDGNGNLPPGAIKAPYIRKGSRKFVVTVTEQGNPAQTVSTPSRVTALRVDVKPSRARPRSRITFRGTGFTGKQRTIWAHYVRGNSRKAKKTVRLGRAKGVCGSFKVKRRQFPFTPRTGTWTVQIDQQKRYSKRPNSVFVRLQIVVRRILRR